MSNHLGGTSLPSLRRLDSHFRQFVSEHNRLLQRAIRDAANRAQSAAQAVPARNNAAAAVPAAVQFLARTDPPNRAEVAFWNCRNSNNCCLRCRVTLPRNATARKLHYKEDHYEVFYTIGRHSSLVHPLARWLCQRLGEQESKNRACAHCHHRRTTKKYYWRRKSLLNHISKKHFSIFDQLKADYKRRFEAGGYQKIDKDIHRMLKPY